jgi:hypothetical protein
MTTQRTGIQRNGNMTRPPARLRNRIVPKFPWGWSPNINLFGSFFAMCGSEETCFRPSGHSDATSSCCDLGVLAWLTPARDAANSQAQ